MPLGILVDVNNPMAEAELSGSGTKDYCCPAPRSADGSRNGQPLLSAAKEINFAAVISACGDYLSRARELKGQLDLAIETNVRG